MFLNTGTGPLRIRTVIDHDDGLLEDDLDHAGGPQLVTRLL